MPAVKGQPHGYDESNPKIDIRVGGKYVCSTNWSKICKRRPWWRRIIRWFVGLKSK